MVCITVYDATDLNVTLNDIGSTVSEVKHMKQFLCYNRSERNC